MGGGSSYDETYLHPDHLGSAVAGTRSNGAIRWREDYTPYGEKRLNPADHRDNVGFTGHIEDAATGLIYMQARFMDPVTGRFLSKDPVGFSPAAPFMFNRYAYVANDPINNIDPDSRVILGLVSKAFKVLRKGGDVGATFASAAADTRAVLVPKPRWRSRVLCNREIASNVRLIWLEPPHSGSQIGRADGFWRWRSAPQ